MNQYPILEYDDSPDEAIIEPARILKRLDTMPTHLVFCFFRDVLDAVCTQEDVIYKLGSEIGPEYVYGLNVTDHTGAQRRVAVMHPGVGAPLAAGFLEEVIALGAQKFIACGGAGVLDREIAVGHLIVPTRAVRDEGTSYHYLPPAREVSASPAAIAAVSAALTAHDIPYAQGKTWTTDGIYRETKARIARRKAEGCLTVEMEAAAFFAVAQFRGVTFGQILYGGDDISGEVWDHRSWQSRKSTRERLFWLAVDAVLRL